MLHGMSCADTEQVANSQNESVRTRCRWLEEGNTVFLQVRGDVRRDMAIERLAHSDVSLAQIASEFGFDEVSSLHRAFRAVTGMTPHAYRQASTARRTGIG